MSFTVENIINEIPAHIDEEIDTSDSDELAKALSWANSCMLAMGSRAWRESTQSYPSAVANKWYALPATFINSVMVKTTIGIPTNLALTNEGTAGSTSYSYAVTAVNANGETLACTAVETTTGNATLDETNYNALTWDEVSGATSYYVYRTASDGTPSTTGYIGEATTESFDDTGLSGDSAEVPVEDTSEDEYESYTIRDRRIKFSAADDYILTYTAYPARFTSEDDVVPLQDVYLVPMGKYLAVKYLLMDSRDESSDRETADRLMGEFYNDLNHILGMVEDDNEPFQVQEDW